MNLLRPFLAAAVLSAVMAPQQFIHTQSRPQKSEVPKGNQKKNVRPTEEEQRKAEEERKRAEEEKNAVFEDIVERVETNVVNVDAVVFNKKTGQIVTGLKKEAFTIYENGVKQNIASFATPESPITVTLIVEYSRWAEEIGAMGSGGWEPGFYESVRPVAHFLTKFVKPPDDYASVIAYDIRPTTITDFTNDPARIGETVNLLFRSHPAFRDSNMFDSIRFALIGGKGDSVVLERSEKGSAIYGGMVDVKSPRRAILLVATGLNTHSRYTYDETRRVAMEAGIPIYIISTGNLFFKRYEAMMDPMDGVFGAPGRMSFLQAQNTLKTFAKDTGGAVFPMTFPTEIPGILNSINSLLRSQYSLGYDLAEAHEPGKKYKLEVKVDVDGDGATDEKVYQVQHRPFYTTPKADIKKK